ncbi:MAG TPA: DegT/DnrJ/EryC1/StrS family aminotransferase [Candidatus Dormibacteraeota bacterium]|nr:DegT/DnrJ/EryC1/StrS family aminotransferase [Candidatus Dormibacteraeota bacterium]
MTSSPIAKPKAASVPQQALPPICDFLDLKAQFATIRGEVMDAVTRVMESQLFILGKEVAAFEEEVAAALGAEHAVGCASGTDALILALLAAGVGPGDEVITTPFSFVATAGSIGWIGAKPVFVDIVPETFNIDPKLIEKAITPRTKAIMPVHLFGLSADMDSIVELAAAHKLAVVEDAAQAIGAKYQKRFVGTIGEFGCFSFFPSKNLGGAGDGGLVTTRHAEMAEKIRILRMHGSKQKYHHDVLGTNSRLDALQAAVLRVKLRHLAKWTAGRQGRAARYRELFAAANIAEFVKVPVALSTDYEHVFNQFTIGCQRRDELREYLRMRGIPSDVYYPIPLHLQPAFAGLGYRGGEFPHAEAASAEVLSLPVYAELADEKQDVIVGTIAEFYLGR